MGAVGVGGAIHLPDFEVVDLVAFGKLLCEGKTSVSGDKVKELGKLCTILGIRNVASEELTTDLIDLTGQVVVAE
jgi:hypothetical protein